MICTKCGTILLDNAKFCTKCGNPTPKSDTTIQEQPTSNTGNSTQVPNNIAMSTKQPEHIIIPNIQQPPYYINTVGFIPKQNKTLNIVGGIVIAALIVIIILLVDKNYELNMQVAEHEYWINQYENRGTVDKTIDAVDSWLDFFY